MADVSQVDQNDIKSLWENLETLSGKHLNFWTKVIVTNLTLAHIRTRILY